MAADHDGAGDPRAALRSELLSAFAREGMDYPPERLEEAIDEYAQLKILMKVVEAATCAAASPTAP